MRSSNSAPRLTYVVTHPVTADALLRGQLSYMREHGFDVTVVASPGPELHRVAIREGVRVVPIPMKRQVDPASDLKSLAQLTAAMRSLRPDIVNGSTPKAGLLSMLAARALRVPTRIYLLRGLRLETTRGALRQVLSTTERVASACAHDVVCVSESLRKAAVDGGFVPSHKAKVLGGGSSNGIDPQRWARTPERIAAGAAALAHVGIKDEHEVIGFVGRFERDKGIGDLLRAFRIVVQRRPNARLVLIGGGYAGDLDPEIAAQLKDAEGVISWGKTDHLAPLYARMQVLAFPSYREGFPNVPLEAACAEIPTVGYRSTGVVDAVVANHTGTLVPQGDVAALAEGLIEYLANPDFRRRHGEAARERAATDYSSPSVWLSWLGLYNDCLIHR